MGTERLGTQDPTGLVGTCGPSRLRPFADPHPGTFIEVLGPQDPKGRTPHSFSFPRTRESPRGRTGCVGGVIDLSSTDLRRSRGKGPLHEDERVMDSCCVRQRSTDYLLLIQTVSGAPSRAWTYHFMAYPLRGSDGPWVTSASDARQ